MTQIARMVLLGLILSFAVAGQALADGVPVTISVRAELDGNSLRIRGRATVPDGAWIIYAAYSVAEPRWRVTGYTRIQDDKFAAEAHIGNWPPGEIAVDAHFQILLPEREQPPDIVARFGRNGERMRGKSVVQGGGGFRAAIASTRVIKPDG